MSGFFFLYSGRMKYILVLVLTTAQLTTYAQLFKTHSNKHLHYIDLREETGKVYTMGIFYDVMATGKSIRHIDTVQRQPDGSYMGRYSHIYHANGQRYLLTTLHKTRKLLLDTTFAPVMNRHLNNAYHLRAYSNMSRRLNTAFPLNHFSFRGGFTTWNSLPEETKAMEHMPFREQTDARFRVVEDSVTAAQLVNVRRLNYLQDHLPQMDYATLNDSVQYLPSLTHDELGYYSTSALAIAEQQPAYYLQLVEDNPDLREEFFFHVVYKKSAVSKVKQVKGHDIVKKEFIKERRRNQWMKVYAFSLFGASLVGLGYLGTKIF